MKYFLKSNLVIFLLSFIVCFIAYGQTLQMHFWKDDNALMYKIQRPLEEIGFWGKGIIGEGPYRHIVEQFVSFYPIFGMNPFGYYFIGVILYFLSALGVFYLAKELTGQKKTAGLAMLIYSAGYIGSETIFGITNSWQTSRGILTAVLAFTFFLKYLKNDKFRYYILAFGLFYVTVDTVFIRSHGLFLALITLDLLFAKFSKDVKSILNFILRQAPFLIATYVIYFASPIISIGSNNYLQDILQYKKFFILTSPFQNFGNLFIPSFFTDRISALYPIKIYLQSEFSWVAVLIGVMFCVLTFVLYIVLYKKYQTTAKVLLFSFIWAWANIIAYNAYGSQLILHSTHRYLSYSFVGVSIYFSVLIVYLSSKFMKRQKLFLTMLTLFIILVYLVLGNIYEREFNLSRSFPTKKFFSQLQAQVKKIKQGDIIYIDVANNPTAKSRYASFYGAGMLQDSAIVALFYGLNYNDFTLAADYKELTSKIKSKEDLQKIRTFYFDGSDLVDTTEKFRSFSLNPPVINIPLQNIKGNINFTTSSTFSTATDITVDDIQTVGRSPEISIAADNSSILPIRLSFDMKFNFLYPPLPYKNKNSENILKMEDKVVYYDYLNYLQRFRERVIISSKSIWRDYNVKNLIDGRSDTVWWGSRGYWDDYSRNRVNEPEYLVLDLNETEKIAGILYITNRLPTTPTEYKIFISTNAKDWQLALLVKRVPFPGKSTIIDLFSPQNARFIKIEFYKTAMNDSPDMTEIGVIPAGFEKLDFGILENLNRDPFALISNKQEFQSVINYVSKYGKIKLFWRADNDERQDLWKFKELPVIIDGQFHHYNVEILAGGRKFIDFKLSDINFPVSLELKNVQINYVSPFSI